MTGGARGLGLTMATALAEAGADVALSGRSRATCQEAADGIAKATGRKAAAFEADVTKLADVERLTAEAEAAMGKIDILVNNAGINIRGPVQDLSEADWDAVIDTNLKGPFLCARAIGPLMVKRGWGRVINIGSILGAVGLPGRAPYAASKAGIINLTRVLALEWAGTGVTANAICPGAFGTEMNRPLLDDPEEVQGVRREYSDGPLGRGRRADRRRGLPGLGGVVCTSRARRSSSTADGPRDSVGYCATGPMSIFGGVRTLAGPSVTSSRNGFSKTYTKR